MRETASEAQAQTRLEREVTASLTEFEHGVRLGAGDALERSEPGRYRIRSGVVVLDITARPLRARRCGALSLPTLRVIYDFAGGDQQDHARLLARLDRAMQRGGG